MTDAHLTPPADIPCLPYAQVRPFMRSGDLLMCSGSSPMSKMIQAATDSMFSHVALIWHFDDIDRWMVFESVESVGIRTVPLSNYIINYNRTGKGYLGRLFVARHNGFPVEISHRTIFAQRVADLLGSAYDPREIVSIAWRIVSYKLGMSAKVPHENHLYICSEYAYECYKAIGLEIPFDPSGYIAPKDFYRCKDITLLWEIDTHVS